MVRPLLFAALVPVRRYRHQPLHNLGRQQRVVDAQPRVTRCHTAEW
jgi:hypothetical protein